MKKLAILLLAFALVCSCLVLAACGGDDDTSSPATGTSSAADGSDTSSAKDTSSAATSSKETSSEASVEESSVEPSEEPSADPSDDSSDDSSDEPVAAEAKLLWLTHYNSLGNEGSGVVMSEPYTGGEWWFHCSFAPVDGEDGVYVIVEVLDGSSDGSGHSLDIPDGGFVYALHTGNNYDGGIDYTTEVGATMLTEARTWKAGEKFTFTGIDFENFTDVPTETPTLNWYEDGDNGTGHYVCTATYTKVG